MGSDQYELKALPMVEFVYGGKIFASTQQGIGYNLWRKRTFRAGPRLTFDLGRDTSKFLPISTLPDVETGVEFGVFMEAYKGPWRLRSDIRQEMAGGHDGMLLNFDLAWGQRWTANSSLIFGGRTTYIGEEYAKAYFGVPAASAAPGLPAFGAESGFRDITVYAQLIFDFSKRFFLAVEGRGVMYFGSAADSPVTVSNSTFATSAVIGVRF
jgi:outer membrane scaffolding protein for murein synthesis (MipA/OmpV family)